MQKQSLFNPNGDDTIQNRRVIGGNTTNLFNLNNTKYNWAKQFYRIMNANFWLPEKVDMSQDKIQFSQLTSEQQEIYKSILSFLTFLDSIQTNNIPNVFEWITAPEIKALLVIQQYQEMIHNQSYSYIIESVIPQDERNKVYDLWRDNSFLLNRNKTIASFYQDFIDNQTQQNFYKVLIANYILESVFFYNGFIFFYSLAKENKMMGTADQIRYISLDEKIHIDLFANIINSVKAENNDWLDEDIVKQMFQEAVELELEWNKSIFKNNKYINNETTKAYVYHLVNTSLNKIGIANLYETAYNPYTALEKLSGDNVNNVKSNFFESTVTGYSQSTILDNWDKI